MSPEMTFLICWEIGEIVKLLVEIFSSEKFFLFPNPWMFDMLIVHRMISNPPFPEGDRILR
jgi:hypothetical protein